MSLPPWYRPKRRPLAEAVLTLDLSRATGIGPLTPGLSTRWDMTPCLCTSDPGHRVRVEVDADGRQLRVERRNKPIAPALRLDRDLTRIGNPLRAICPTCGRRSYRLYFAWGWFRCGKCLRVTYASGRGGENDRAHARMARLENRLYFTNRLPRHRGRKKISAEIARQDERLFLAMPARLLRFLARAMND